ncbi:MAG: DUF922 domain-containing protein [Nitratireductor sp.]
MSKRVFSNLFFALFASLVLSANTASSRVIVKERTAYYKISGKTGKQLNIAMIKRGPRQTKLSHAIASTESKMQIKNISLGVRGRKCVILSADVILNLKYTLPKWQMPKATSSELKAGWQKFYGLLVKHEKRHGAISMDAARSVEKELKRLKGNVTKKCEDFGKNAKRRFARVGRTLAIRQRNFDRREGSGFSAITRSQKKLHKLR